MSPAAFAINTIESAKLGLHRQKVDPERNAQAAAVYRSENYIMKQK
jgi:hypothetical protein